MPIRAHKVDISSVNTVGQMSLQEKDVFRRVGAIKDIRLTITLPTL